MNIPLILVTFVVESVEESDHDIDECCIIIGFEIVQPQKYINTITGKNKNNKREGMPPKDANNLKKARNDGR